MPVFLQDGTGPCPRLVRSQPPQLSHPNGQIIRHEGEDGDELVLRVQEGSVLPFQEEVDEFLCLRLILRS